MSQELEIVAHSEIVEARHELGPAVEPSDEMTLMERLITVLGVMANTTDEQAAQEAAAYELREMVRAALGIDLHSQGFSDSTMRDAFFLKWGIKPPPALTHKQAEILRLK